MPVPWRRSRRRVQQRRRTLRRRLADWWNRVELDVTYPLVLAVVGADAALLLADVLQPFTPALHWAWGAAWCALVALQLVAVGRYIRDKTEWPRDAPSPGGDEE